MSSSTDDNHVTFECPRTAPFFHTRTLNFNAITTVEVGAFEPLKRLASM